MNIFGYGTLAGQDIISIMDHVIVSAKITKTVMIGWFCRKILGGYLSLFYHAKN
jgi:hypothetical protein